MKSIGTFAKLDKVPVEGGHQGGRLEIFSTNKSQSTSIQGENHDQMFLLSAYFTNSRVEMEPVTEGSLLTLEFKLMLSKSLPMGLSSFVFPTYLSALTRVKESLSSWANQREHDNKEEENVINNIVGK